LFTELKAKDNTDRRRTISNVTKAIEYTKLGYIKDAIKTIGKTFNYNRTIVDQKRSLHCLKTVLENRHLFEGKKIIDLYNFLNQSKLYALKKLIAGGAKTFYETEDYDALAISVKNLYEAGSHRIIHKAKGDEFEAVMLVLDKDDKGNFNESNELAFLFAPNLSLEEQRIMYVAVSRPKNHLAISVPTLSHANDTILQSHNIFIHRIP
jgi:DNA helicase II / ATP-dependent DNA helicase PcrA